ncbi:MAG TPA: tRNA dimethylallyltransferase, partial [Ohtaekwangia sp.]|nr:tRNA dimethylallyltransferase [Ohtaekwangia sp.]
MRVLDPKHYSSIDNMNPHRLIRALEVVMETGKSIVSFRKRVRHQHPFRIVKIGLDLPKEELNHRIDTRMDAMIAAGLIQEAQALYRFKDHQALKTVGYQEVFDMMEGKYDEAEMIRLLKRNSRHYAKRQLTWFRRDPEIIWMNPFDIDEIISAVSSAGKASRDQ